MNSSLVAGLGTIGIYGCVIASQGCWSWSRQRLAYTPNQATATVTDCGELKVGSPSLRKWMVMLAVFCASLLVTCVNPYGIKFWSYVLPAVWRSGHSSLNGNRSRC